MLRKMLIKFERYVTALLSLIIVVFLMRMFLDHWAMIWFPYQLEYREGATLMNMLLFVDSPWNIHAWEFKPLFANVYGFFYFYCAAPLVELLGPQLSSLRLASAVSIWCLLALVFWATVSSIGSIFYALVACAIIYSATLTGVTPLARPDAVGMLFFTAALVVAWKGDNSKLSLTFATFLCWVAAFTKPYFLLALGLIAADIFIRQSMARSIVYFISATATFALLLIVMNSESFFPSYISEVWGNNAQTPVGKLSHSIFQVKILVREYWLLPVLAATAVSLKIGSIKSFFADLKVVPVGINRPLFNVEVNALLCYFLISSLICFFYLGTNPGNHLVYFIHLCLPIATIYLFTFFTNEITGCVRFFAQVVSVASVVLLVLDPFDNRNLEPARAGFEELSQFVQVDVPTYSNPMLVSLFLSANKPIVDSGITQYFGFQAHLKTDSSRRMFALREKWLDEIHTSLGDNRYSRLFLTAGPHSNLHGFSQSLNKYRLTKSIQLPLPSQSLTIEVYDRKNNELTQP